MTFTSRSPFNYEPENSKPTRNSLSYFLWPAADGAGDRGVKEGGRKRRRTRLIHVASFNLIQFQRCWKSDWSRKQIGSEDFIDLLQMAPADPGVNHSPFKETNQNRLSDSKHCRRYQSTRWNPISEIYQKEKRKKKNGSRKSNQIDWLNLLEFIWSDRNLWLEPG